MLKMKSIKKISVLVLVLVMTFVAAVVPQSISAASAYIRVNQVGYMTSGQKVAYVLTNNSLNGASFTINQGGMAVYTGTIGADKGSYATFSHLYILDFSGFKTNGTYTINLSGTVSPQFIIGSDIYSSFLPLSLEFFKGQRCGNTSPSLHGVCHLGDSIAKGGPMNGKQLDVTGGWHDSGDFIKFATTAGYVECSMLTAYLRNPDAFANCPSFLQEVRVGLDWLYKLWDNTNQVMYYQVADGKDHDYAYRMPENDTNPNRWAYPLSSGQGGDVCGKAAASLALGYLTFKDTDTALASKYLTAAKQIYAYGKTRTTPQKQEFYGESDTKDDLALAAIELYKATNIGSYLTEAKSFIQAAAGGGDYSWDNSAPLASYEIGRADSQYKPIAISVLRNLVTSSVSKMNASKFQIGASSSGWGFIEILADKSLQALWYKDLSGDNTYDALIANHLNYTFGANPWGISFVSHAGTTWQKAYEHGVATLTGSDLPGCWDEGPCTWSEIKNNGFMLGSMGAFDTNEFCFDPSGADYCCNEPTTTANSVGVALLSWLVGSGTPTPTPTPTTTPTPGPVWNSTTSYSAGTHNLGSTNTGVRTTEFDLAPLANGIDGLVGYADTSVTVTAATNFAMITRTNVNGTFEVRNGAAYAALTAVPYSANNTYHFKMVTDLNAKTYSVWVTPPGGSPIQIASNYAFRSDAPATDDLGQVCVRTQAADNQMKVANHIVYQ